MCLCVHPVIRTHPHGRRRPPRDVPETYWETSNHGRTSWKQFHNGVILARRHRTPRQSRFHGAVNTWSRCALPPPLSQTYSFPDSQLIPLRHHPVLAYIQPADLPDISHSYAQDGDPFLVCPFLHLCGILGVVKTCFIGPSHPIVLLTSDPSRSFDKWKPERSPKFKSRTFEAHPINYQRQRYMGINAQEHSIRAVPDTPSSYYLSPLPSANWLPSGHLIRTL